MNIRDLAKMAGVSIATISRVINGDPRVTDENRKKVLAVIEETKYVPNKLGCNLRRSATHMILVTVPDMGNTFYADVMYGIEQKAYEQDYNMLIYPTHGMIEKEEYCVSMLQNRLMDGLIMCSCSFETDHLNELAAQYPIVQCCEYRQDSRTPIVTIDDTKAGYDVTRYFLQKGHTAIAFLGSEKEIHSNILRRRGYQTALLEANLPILPEYLVGEDYAAESGYRIAEKLFSLPNKPTALVTIADVIAVGAIRWLREHKYRVPEDVEVFGFDDTPIAMETSPMLSTVTQPKNLIGRHAMQSLLNKIEDIHSENPRVLLDYSLTFRESTR